MSYGINTQDWTNTGTSLNNTPYGIYSLYTGVGRREDEIDQPSTTMMFTDGSIARGWTFWNPIENTSLENECFHIAGKANFVCVDGHAQTVDCQRSWPGYTRTDWAIPEFWYRIDQ